MNATSARNNTLLRYFYPLELLVMATALLVGISYWYLQMPSRVLPGFYWTQIIITAIVYAHFRFFAACYLFFTWWRSDPSAGFQLTRTRAGNDFSTIYSTRARLLRDSRLMLGFLLILALFTHLKHLTPIVNPTIFDSWFSFAEHWIFGGVSPTTQLISLLGPQYADFFSGIYTAFYPYMTAIFIFFVLINDKVHGERFAFAYGLLWIIGTLMIYAVPTWGPVYFEPASIALLPTNSKVAQIQQELWRWKLAFDVDPRPLASQFLISGQPSLHIAVTTLGSMYLWSVNKTLGILSWFFTALTWVTTIYFGWHYISDNVLALVLVGVSNWIACRVVQKPRSA